jgi:hypothetical protein
MVEHGSRIMRTWSGVVLALVAGGCGQVEVSTDADTIDAHPIADAAGDDDASFDAGPSYYTLTVTLDGTGSGSVVSTPSGID